MSIRTLVIAGIAYGLGASSPAIAAQSSFKDYELPPLAGRAKLPDSASAYKTQRYNLTRSKPILNEASVDKETYVFAKESFLAEKRDQAIKLLRQEIDSGKTQNRHTSLLRLGQLYAEKYMELSYLENTVYSEKLAQMEEAKKAGKKTKKPRFDNHRSQAYLKKALKLFYELERKYPKHPSLDEVIFFIGFVELESGNAKKGVRYLERVVSRYPKSRKYDEAVLYLGDYYFDKHQFKKAANRFSILLRKKGEHLYYYAKYKIAWVHLNTRRGKLALREMRQLISELEGTKDKAKFNLRKQAIGDLVAFYAEVGNPREAYAFFKEHMSREDALASLRLIADAYRAKAKDKYAIYAYELLLREDPKHPEAPIIQLGIYDSLTRMGQSTKAIKHLVAAIKSYGANSDFANDFPKDKADELNYLLESVKKEGYKAATFHHHAAQKGTNKAHYVYALALYSALLESYPKDPEFKQMSFYRAEILYAQKKWLAAADAYMEVSKIPPKDKMSDESVYNALLALDELTSRSTELVRYSGKKIEDLPEKDIPRGESRFIEVAQLYMKDYPKGSRIVDVKFRIAGIYYRHHYFEKAKVGFDEIATHHPKHRSAVTCAGLVLDILNLQKKYDELDATALRYAAIKPLGNSKFKAEMGQLRDEIQFKKVESLEGGGKWKEAGDTYMKIYRQNPKGKLAEQSLYNSIIAYQKAKMEVQAEAGAVMFIKAYPSSKRTQQLSLELAKNAEKRFDYARAQKLYETFAIKYPKHSEARKSLYNSAVFAELLGLNQSALRLYDRYMRLGGVDEEERNAITLSRAKISQRLKRYKDMETEYRRLVYRSKSVGDKADYLGALAHQYDNAGRIADKNRVAKEIYWFYTKQPSAIKGLALAYVAEEKFKRTDSQLKRFEKVRLSFPPERLVNLLKQKQSNLQRLSKAYDDVIAVGVPEWGVKAALSKAIAYDAFVAAYRSVKIPSKYSKEQKEEAAKNLKEIDGQVAAPVEAQAATIYDACAKKAVEFYVDSPAAAQCFSKAPSVAKAPEPSGIVPSPAYWSTRPAGKEVVLR